MKLIDQNARDEIMADSKDVVISASAGSGKTTIMIRKLKSVLEEITCHKTVAAITFTKKATEEIKNKALDEGIQKDFITMTNDAFIEHEIIRPFIRDTFGNEYSDEFTVVYDLKFSDFEEGLQSIVDNNKLGVFYDIKSNFKFQLALHILKNNQVAREYLQYKFKVLFLDEYQDSDLDMHNLFMYIKEVLNINLFIVGDAKQAIYLWRGAQKNIFELLAGSKFNYYKLITNFRSDPEIVNYANLLHNSKYFNIDYQTPVSHVLHCKTKDFIKSFTRMVHNKEIDINKEITIIINFNNDAQRCADDLNGAGYNFQFIPRTPIDENTPNSHFLHFLACYILDKNYSIYDLIENINVDSRKQMVIRMESIIDNLLSVKGIKQNTVTTTFNSLEKLFEIKFTNDELTRFFDTLINEEYHAAFIATKDIHKVMTVFASKGLEFDQVVSFSRFYPSNDENKQNNHYVCVTRAKDKFIMIDDSWNYESHLNKHALKLGIQNLEYLYRTVSDFDLD